MKTWIALILLLVLAVPFTALAQGDEQEWDEFVSEDENITLNHPAGWYVEGSLTSQPTPIVFIANSEDALYREEFESGDIALILTFVPVANLGDMDLELPDDYELIDIINAIITQSMESEGSADFEEAEVMDVEINEDETLEVARAAFTSEIYDGAMYVMIQGDTMIMALMAAYPDEFSEDVEALTLGTFTSIHYTPLVEAEATAEPTEEPAE